MEFKTEQFEIGEHFLCALYYGDVSGLDDGECALLEDFIAEHGDRIAGEVSRDEFGLCEITGLRGATVTVSLIVKECQP